MRVGSLNWFWVIWNWFCDLIRFKDINDLFFFSSSKEDASSLWLLFRLSPIENLNQVSIENGLWVIRYLL